ncbi:MAG: glycerophosphodiester phosphodiesterase [Clostridia bacterium]|nr:glycerophosphodiester phosphodiesterase [Clostridia bacterium]
MIESIVSVLLIAAVLYILSVGGRSGHPNLQTLRSHAYAHRGLHNHTRPENSLSAFRAAREKGYGVELDVHLLSDGTLAVFHDHTLIRMTGQNGKIEDLTAEDLAAYTLGDTTETIPTFREVLDVFGNAVPLIVELKAAGNHRELVHATVKALEEYEGPYCIESFDPRCLWYLRRDFPHIVRGQLAQDFFKNKEDLSAPIRFVLTHLLTNFLTRPDFVAYRFTDRNALSVRIARKLWRVQGVVWTLTDPEQHRTALEENFIPIFEEYEP